MDPFLFCLLVAAVVTRIPAAVADAYTARKAADAGEWDFLKDRAARRDARAQRIADMAGRILDRRQVKAEGVGPKRAGLGTLLSDIYHSACEDALARREARRPDTPDPPTKGGKRSLFDRVTDKLRERVDKFRSRPARARPAVEPVAESTVRPAVDVEDVVEAWRDDLDDEGLALLRGRRCVWATDPGYCGAAVTDPELVYCDPHVDEWQATFGRPDMNIGDAPPPTPESPDRSTPQVAPRTRVEDPTYCADPKCARLLHGRWSSSPGGKPVCADGCHSTEQPAPRKCRCRACTGAGAGAALPGGICPFHGPYLDEKCPPCNPKVCPTCKKAMSTVLGGIATCDCCPVCGRRRPCGCRKTLPNPEQRGDTPMTAPTGNATIEDVQTNEAARRSFEQMGEGAAKLQEAATMAEQARAQIAAAALAAGDGMSSIAFDAAAKAAVADINDVVQDATLSKWSETADQIQAAAKQGHGSLEKYRVGEEVVAENNVDARTLQATAS